MSFFELIKSSNFSKAKFMYENSLRTPEDNHNYAIALHACGNKEGAVKLMNTLSTPKSVLAKAFFMLEEPPSVDLYLKIIQFVESNFDILKDFIQTYFILGECHSRLYHVEQAVKAHATGLSIHVTLKVPVTQNKYLAYGDFDQNFWFQHCAECPLNYLYVDNDNIDDMMKINKIFNEISGKYQSVVTTLRSGWICDQFKDVYSQSGQTFPIRFKHKKPRVGYISENLFSLSSVNRVVFPFIEHHSDKFDFFYFTFTEPFIHGCGETIFLESTNFHSAAKIIYDYHLDILINIDGRTNKNRVMKLLKNKLAKVQVDYCGYPSTTTMNTIDYKIVDKITDPVEYAQSYYTEKLAYKEGCFITFKLYDEIPQIPCKNNNRKCIGAFHNIKKISPKIASVWDKILSLNSNIDIYLKYATYDPNTPGICEKYEGFDKYFINQMFPKNRNRVKILSYTPSRTDNFRDLLKMDIFLDTYPYTSTITALEVLSLGIPIVTLQGRTHRSRVTSSILHHMGHPELIATTSEEYVAKVLALIHNDDKLQFYKKQLPLSFKKIQQYDIFANDMERLFVDFIDNISFKIIVTNDAYVFNTIKKYLEQNNIYCEFCQTFDECFFKNNTIFLTFRCPTFVPKGSEIFWVPGLTSLDVTTPELLTHFDKLTYEEHERACEEFIKHNGTKKTLQEMIFYLTEKNIPMEKHGISFNRKYKKIT